MKLTYPVFIKPKGKDYLVYVPVFKIYTEGTTFDDAVLMAHDAVKTMCLEMISDGDALPDAPSKEIALAEAKADADEDFDYSDGKMMFVEITVNESADENEIEQVDIIYSEGF